MLPIKSVMDFSMPCISNKRRCWNEWNSCKPSEQKFSKTNKRCGLLQHMGELRRAPSAAARQCHTRARRFEASVQQLPKLSTASPMIFSFQVLRSNSTHELQQ
ncbi:hypothetical protein QL285_096408 [Trifolium repens]|nr:hypothetical protein QL285_096408 [Trifolium repens]